MIVKHANPCGVAVAGSIEQAYDRALAADPLSAYGGVVVLNRPVSEALGEKLAEQFVEVLFAPGYDETALELLQQKPATRILEDSERRFSNPGERDYKRVLGGMLVQERDSDIEDRDGMEVVCGAPTEMAWGDLLFAWRVCKHVSSNAIVLVRDLQTIGIGAGQMSRVDAVRLALEKAREHDHELAGRGAGLRCVLPVRRRPAAGPRRGRERLHPARRLEARRRGDRGRRARGRDDGLHGPPPLPALMDDLELRNLVYRRFVELGRAPTMDELGTTEAALRRLHDAHMIVLEPDRPEIRMANPFSAVPDPLPRSRRTGDRGSPTARGMPSGSRSRWASTATSRLRAPTAASRSRSIWSAGGRSRQTPSSTCSFPPAAGGTTSSSPEAR